MLSLPVQGHLREPQTLARPRSTLATARYVPFVQLKPRVLEQQIAVFGESGSGKTVLISSFYGATQEPQFLKSSRFHVTADDTGRGHQLHANYLGMKDSRRPEPTRFSSTPYAFTVRLRDKGQRRAAQAIRRPAPRLA